MCTTKKISVIWIVLIGIVLAFPLAGMAQKKALTFTDVMKFRAIRNAVISDDGNIIAYTAKPDRGDGEVKVHRLRKKAVFTIERGERAAISHDSRWVVSPVSPKAVDLESAKNDKDKPKKGLALLDLSTGEITHYDRVDKFLLSEDSKWLAIQYFKQEKKDKKKDSNKSDSDAVDDKDTKKSKSTVGSKVVLVQLDTHQKIKLDFVHIFAFDTTSAYFTFSVADSSGFGNGLFTLSLKEKNIPQKIIDLTQKGHYSHLTWNDRKGVLAFVSAVENEQGEPDSASLWIWDPQKERFLGAVLEDALAEDWIVPAKNNLVWTRDGARLFFGLKPASDVEDRDSDSDPDSTGEAIDLFDMETILEKREVDVWHWNDPLIIPQQKIRWKNEKDRTYSALYHLDSDKIVPLADKDMPGVRIPQNSRYALGSSDVPYRKLVTWEGRFSDYYIIDLQDGSREKIASRLGRWATLSPGGQFAVYYQDHHWFLTNCETGETRNLTKELKVPFENEDHDYPEPAPGYGVGGWIENDEAVLIYDKYDIWQFPTDSGKSFRITGGEGRENKRIFRIQRMDPEQLFYKNGETVLLSAYHDLRKNHGFYSGQIGKQGVNRLLEEPRKYRFLAKAKNSDRLIYTRESYTEFPNIWVSDVTFRSPKKVTRENLQLKDFAWGTAELVEWNSIDGIPLQGVLIKPGNYVKGKRYPVLVYYYRFFSQRLHEFNSMVVNHRPNFPFYASNGYAVFLPDIRFEIGRPGFAATKCLVPGVQKLVDMGIADPKAVALHGHSWSGYQTAFVITQTDLFACAVAGAPVSNMTSAYSGIRYGSGLARQFQYEQSQSRIGRSLWEAPQQYIENSPVFFADKINTPLLIMFGDEDGAVPWTQGIELYLAMRRLEKDCVFLQYRGEPHHPQKYGNKLDYSIKMKEYLDHYCKGLPAADWIKSGVPYRGK